MIFAWFSLLAIVSMTWAWEDCPTKLVRTAQTNNMDYKQITQIDMINLQPVIKFSVKACKTAKLRFTQGASSAKGMNLNFDINVDVNGKQSSGNQFFSARYRPGGSARAIPFKNHKQSFLHCNNFKNFWLTWTIDSGKVSIGKGHRVGQNKVLTFTIPSKYRASPKNLYVTSQNKGTWRFYEQCAVLAEDIPECTQDSDCMENSYCEVGTCEQCPEGTVLDENECKETCSITKPCTSGNEGCIAGLCEECDPFEQAVNNECVSVCSLKKNKDDNCDKIPRFYYKATTEQCKETMDCEDAVGNSFLSLEECAGVCSPRTLPPECLDEAETGPCKSFQTMYHYDAGLRACKKFTWGGCEGNGNNFHSKEECREHCKKYDVL